MTIDFDKIKQAAQPHLEALCFEMFPDGDVQGDQFRIGNIRGERGNKGGSFHVDLDDGWWIDMNPAEGQHGGDIISLWASRYGMNNTDAARDLDAKLSAGAIQATAKGTSQGNRAKSDKNDWVALPFAETEASAPTTKRVQRNGVWADFPVSRSWEYRDAQGRQVGFICRVDFGEGVKDCFPYTFCVNSVTGERKWNWRRFAAPRPLFNLAAFALRPKAGVLIVEGEKKAEIMQREWPDVVVTTWVGGAAAIIYHPEEIDWTPLTGRRVTLWPDADSQCVHDTTELLPALKQPGIAAMVSVESAIKAIAARTFIVLPPDDWKDGYDLADAIADGWTLERIKAHIKQRRDENTRLGVSVVADLEARASTVRIEAPASIPAEEPEHVAEPPDDLIVNEPSSSVEQTKKKPKPNAEPFRYLGYNDGDFFYLPRGMGQVVRLAAGQHKKLNLLQLAPLEWWEDMFGQDKDGSCDWDMAVNALFFHGQQAGVYDPANVRGRGAWIDNGEVILHVGNQIISNGISMPIDNWKTNYIYQTGRKLDWDDVKPLPQADSEDGMPGAAQLLKVCELLPWKHPMSAKLFSGWCVLAPICGVLSWRPHIWITGPAGSGKSYTLVNFVEPLLGSMNLSVLSATTEAGIRQRLRADALPVEFDEAESEDERAKSRIQGILELARQASSEGQAEIVKGTTGGVAMNFKIRSMFCFASIGVAAVNNADVSRATVLEFYKRNDVAAFDALKEAWASTIGTEGFCGGIRARSLSLAMTIRHNCKSFSRACSMRLKDQRAGDQVGALLAGAFSLTSQREVTPEEATKIIASYDWSLFERTVSDADEWKCWSRLLDAQVRVKDIHGVDTISVGELIEIARNSSEIDDTGNEARGVLKRTGVDVTSTSIYVACSSSHAELSRIFKDTQFSGKWKEYLNRLPDSEYISSWKFIAGHRAVRIPLTILDTKENNAIV